MKMRSLKIVRIRKHGFKYIELTVLVTFEDFLLTNLYIEVQQKLIKALRTFISGETATKLSLHTCFM
jgi:hypothetical protein